MIIENLDAGTVRNPAERYKGTGSQTPRMRSANVPPRGEWHDSTLMQATRRSVELSTALDTERTSRAPVMQQGNVVRGREATRAASMQRQCYFAAGAPTACPSRPAMSRTSEP